MNVNLQDIVESPHLQHEVQDIINDKSVLILPKQDLNPTMLRKFAQCFGDVGAKHPLYSSVPEEPLVSVLETGPTKPPDSSIFHTDFTFREFPNLYGILQSVRPPVRGGGDTLFMSTCNSYDALSSALQHRLDGLTVEHCLASGFKQFTSDDKYMELLRNNEKYTHPLICQHPKNGRKFINVNDSFATRIPELSALESKHMLSLLSEHNNNPDFQIRHKWSQGDVVLWDNLATQHYAAGDYYPQHRVMHRVHVGLEALSAPM